MGQLTDIIPNEKMLNSIIFSVKPKYLELILSKDKIYEFRNFHPKSFNSYFWIYETKPIMKLKYLMKVSPPIVFPEKIVSNTYGVNRFNIGTMQAKYAYKIEELYILNEPLSLKELQNTFNFTAPQAFTYLFNNKKLQSFLKNNAKLHQIF